MTGEEKGEETGTVELEERSNIALLRFPSAKIANNISKFSAHFVASDQMNLLPQLCSLFLLCGASFQ